MEAGQHPASGGKGKLVCATALAGGQAVRHGLPLRGKAVAPDACPCHPPSGSPAGSGSLPTDRDGRISCPECGALGDVETTQAAWRSYRPRIGSRRETLTCGN